MSIISPDGRCPQTYFIMGVTVNLHRAPGMKMKGAGKKKIKKWKGWPRPEKVALSKRGPVRAVYGTWRHAWRRESYQIQCPIPYEYLLSASRFKTHFTWPLEACFHNPTHKCLSPQISIVFTFRRDMK